MNLTSTPKLSGLTSLPLDLEIFMETPKLSGNATNHTLGLALMFLNKIRHQTKGYTSARGFSFEDMERAINYDFRVIKRWVDYLEQYQQGASTINGKNVLELGPGADLGIGLIMLAEGAKNYHALDVHNLVKGTPPQFYEQLFQHLQKDPYLKTEIDTLKKQLTTTQNGNNDRLNYVCRPDFDLSVFAGKNIDLIVSNSAFQQFDNPAKTIQELSGIVNPGAVFIALLDLKTHMRWINQRDPLNIYRYSDKIYNLLKFKGAQNRMRPTEFKALLEQNGWRNVKIIPRIQVDQSYLQEVTPSLDSKFRPSKNQMEMLTCLICATKA